MRILLVFRHLGLEQIGYFTKRCTFILSFSLFPFLGDFTLYWIFDDIYSWSITIHTYIVHCPLQDVIFFWMLDLDYSYSATVWFHYPTFFWSKWKLFIVNFFKHHHELNWIFIQYTEPLNQEGNPFKNTLQRTPPPPPPPPLPRNWLEKWSWLVDNTLNRSTNRETPSKNTLQSPPPLPSKGLARGVNLITAQYAEQLN